MNVNIYEPVFYTCSITTNDPYAKLCVPDTFKNINVKVFNLMPTAKEARHIELIYKLLNINVE